MKRSLTRNPTLWVLLLIIVFTTSACGATGIANQSPAGLAYGENGNSGIGPGGGRSGGMGRGNMGQGGMGPGMMGGNGQPGRNFSTGFPTVPPGDSNKVSFQQDVLPILEHGCVQCHGGEGGLYLDSYDHVMDGGENGTVVVPGKPAQSELVKRINGTSQPRMPLGGSPLSSTTINIVVNWIKVGASDN